AFSAALYAFQFVVRYLLRCLFFVSVTQSVYGHQHRDLCNKADKDGTRGPAIQLSKHPMACGHNVIEGLGSGIKPSGADATEKTDLPASQYSVTQP
ncbi:hypothetical protein, partial [Acidovorax sp. SUPP2522]|uniref:hypothetical protein n=1 Tax=Acidovorax sp. SUPP2522 TaxID=511900 RepID=UPI0024E0510A